MPPEALLFLLLFLLYPPNLHCYCHEYPQNDSACAPFHCGQFTNIGFPFYRNPTCGPPNFPLLCEENRVWLPTETSRRLEVKNISFRGQFLQVVDIELLAQVAQRNCILPEEIDYTKLGYMSENKRNTYVEIFICSRKGGRAAACDRDSIMYRYTNEKDQIWRLSRGKAQERVVAKRYPVRIDRAQVEAGELVEVIRDGFYLKWKTDFHCDEKGCRCRAGRSSVKIIAGCLVGVVVVILIIAVISTKSKREEKAYPNVEDFLKDYKVLMPTRYSCAEIKKITNGLRKKVGQGGSGCVFKGKLSNGKPVAVKVLNKSSECADAFINEVATIGRIHHVNVVSLLGFCSERQKRALIYEFMPNGSLEKYIHTKGNRARRLPWEKTFEIALGIGRGVWYLHQGCRMQITHFDIKPHNILLDKDFNPKISDFGLARLYSKDKNAISSMAARGTLGYIAPELFSKGFGPVSCKSDVYSYGMLVLDMIGRRQNDDVEVENQSEMYFPAWAYEQLRQGRKLELGEISESEEKIVQKMAIVGLWCVQTKPTDRPCMKMVVQMLEGSLENLEIPPKPPFVSL